MNRSAVVIAVRRMGARSFHASAAAAKPRVCVLGTGWSSFALAKNIDRSAFDVTVVSPRNHMLFTPLLASTTVGTLEFRSIAEPLKASLPDINFVQAHCTGIDFGRRVVHAVETPRGGKGGVAADAMVADIPFDILAVGIGARNNTFGIPGVVENMHFLKELADARAIRQQLVRNVQAAAFPGVTLAERRRLLSFVFVGGGPTSVEAAAELHDALVEDVVRQYPHLLPDVSITIIEGRQLLGAFDASLREYAEKKFARDRIRVRTGANVVRVEPGLVHLSDGESIPFGLGLWATGIGAQPMVASLGPDVVRKDAWGHVLANDFLEILKPVPPVAAAVAAAPAAASAGAGAASAASSSTTAGATAAAGGGGGAASSLAREEPYPGVFVMGDCASVGTHRYAATAQVAEQQGTWLARRLNAAAAHAAKTVGPSASPKAVVEAVTSYRPDKPFEYVHRGSLAFVGTFSAVSDFTQGSFWKPLYGAKVKGAAAWFLWRSAYLTKLGSWRNRLQVPLDWTRTLIFGRDTTMF